MEALDYPDFDGDLPFSSIVVGSEAFPNFQANPQQKGIIIRSLVDELPVVHVEGPPGTGKSTMASLAVKAILQQIGSAKILVCAPSNKAADHLSRLLYRIQQAEEVPMRMIHLYYFGYEDLQSITEVPYALHNLAMAGNFGSEELEELQERIRAGQEELEQIQFGELDSGAEKTAIFKNGCDLNEQIAKDRAALYQSFLQVYDPNIVVATCMGTGDDQLQTSHMEFTHVLVDEVGQAHVPEAIFAISHLSWQNAGQVFLVGDRHQLPPVVLSAGEVGNHLETCLPAALEDVKVFKRVRLRVNYRIIQPFCRSQTNTHTTMNWSLQSSQKIGPCSRIDFHSQSGDIHGCSAASQGRRISQQGRFQGRTRVKATGQ